MLNYYVSFGTILNDTKIYKNSRQRLEQRTKTFRSFRADRPTDRQTSHPTIQPAIQPTNIPSIQPTNRPTKKPTIHPSNRPNQRQLPANPPKDGHT